MSAPRPKPPSRRSPPSKPVNPADWLEQTEQLVDRYRKQLNATAGAAADPGLGYIWIAADHIFESQGRAADFALLDVAGLLEDCAWLVTGKTAQFANALAAFYAFLAEARLIDPARASSIRADLARVLERTG
jgi:hypothetical protein